MTNHAAELKKYKMKKWRNLVFGSLGRTGGPQWWLDLLQPPSDRDAEPGRLLRKLGDFQQNKKAALTSPPHTTKPVFGLQYFSAPIHPVQLFHLLHTTTGSAADSQGLSHCRRRDLKDLRCGQVPPADFWEKLGRSVSTALAEMMVAKQMHFPLVMERTRGMFTQSSSLKLWRVRFFNSVCLAWSKLSENNCLSPHPR